jgi:multidrug efflux system membrane fusion protein
VFVVKPDMTAEKRDVVLERTQGTLAVISKGVEPGEQVVTDGQLSVVPGGKVALKSTPISQASVPAKGE